MPPVLALGLREKDTWPRVASAQRSQDSSPRERPATPDRTSSGRVETRSSILVGPRETIVRYDGNAWCPRLQEGLAARREDPAADVHRHLDRPLAVAVRALAPELDDEQWLPLARVFRDVSFRG